MEQRVSQEVSSEKSGEVYKKDITGVNRYVTKNKSEKIS